jgi:hypothetical protein
MILTPLIAIVPLIAQSAQGTAPAKPGTQSGAAVTLNRVYKVGDKLQYEVDGYLYQEGREIGLDTWIPDEDSFVYKFTTEVTSLKPDGGALLHYLRPTLEWTEGQTADSPQKTRVEKLGMDAVLMVSRCNEILSVKDQTKKKPDQGGNSSGGNDNGGSGDGSQMTVRDAHATPVARAQLNEIIDSFIGGMADMVLFLGSIDSSVDLSPKLPWVPVTPGYTWKKTGGFSPQKLKESGKMAVQRLDYTYTYVGPMDVGGKQVLRVHADLALDTDLGVYLAQIMGVKAEDIELKSIPFKLTSQMDFDLDPVTKRTIKALATSAAEGHIFLTRYENAYEEVKLKGKTTMKLLSAKP